MLESLGERIQSEQNKLFSCNNVIEVSVMSTYSVQERD